jgi:hypothetical protein
MSLEFRNIENLVSKFSQQIETSYFRNLILKMYSQHFSCSTNRSTEISQYQHVKCHF